MGKKKGGYLILELAFVMVVSAIIGAVGIANWGGYYDNAKASVAQNEVMQLGNAVTHYKYDIGTYPDSLDDLALAGTGKLEGYGPWISEVKKDPWGNAYVLQTGTNGFVVYCTENGSQSNSDGNALDSGIIGFHGL